MLKFCPLFSSSSGNSVYIGDREGGILIDVGRSAKQTDLMLEKIGVDVDSLRGILLTHEHTDHVNGLSVFAKKHKIPIYAAPGTLLELRNKGIINENHIDNAIGTDDFSVAGLNIKPVRTSHDCADGRAYVITGCDGVTKLSVATDTGYISPDLLSEITGSKLVYIESNHDVAMVRTGPYPYNLQQRILSNHGHLSNDACADALTALINKGTTHVCLAHLSRENNTPELAYNTSVDTLKELGALNGRDYILKVADPENQDGIIKI